MLTSSWHIASAVSNLKLSTLQLHQSALTPPLRFSTLMQLISSLPRLRIVDFVDCTLEEDTLPSAICSVRGDLEVRFNTCSPPGFPLRWRCEEFKIILALSPIRKLVIDGPLSGHSVQLAREYPLHTKPARVDAFESRWYWYHNVTPNQHFRCFQRYVDLKSLRALTLHGTLCDGPVTFLDPAPPALEELTYHVTDSSPSLGTWTSLRSVTLVGELPIMPNGPCEWPNIVRDLHALPTPGLRHVRILLQVLNGYGERPPSWRTMLSADVLFKHFRRSLTGQNWAQLAACLARFTALQTFRLEAELYSSSPNNSGLSKDVMRCIRIMQEVVAASLPQAIVAVTKVNAVVP